MVWFSNWCLDDCSASPEGFLRRWLQLFGATLMKIPCNVCCGHLECSSRLLLEVGNASGWFLYTICLLVSKPQQLRFVLLGCCPQIIAFCYDTVTIEVLIVIKPEVFKKASRLKMKCGWNLLRIYRFVIVFSEWKVLIILGHNFHTFSYQFLCEFLLIFWFKFFGSVQKYFVLWTKTKDGLISKYSLFLFIADNTIEFILKH